MAIIISKTTIRDRSRFPATTTAPVSAQIELGVTSGGVKAIGIVRAEAATREIVMELRSGGRLLDEARVTLLAGESKRLTVGSRRVGENTDVRILHAGVQLCGVAV